MNETLTALVPVYGLWLVASVTFLSCLAVPVPSSLLMIAAGSFAAAGDLSLTSITIAAFAGASVGDQVGFSIGRRGSTFLERMKNAGGQREILYNRAHVFSDKWGGIGVFLSRWLLSPLGPYVNFISGASGVKWPVFTLAAATGEAIWVTLYTGLGYVFSDQIEMVADIASNISGFLAAAVLAIVLGRIALRGNRQGETDP